MKQKHKMVKLHARVTLADYQRFDAIREKYGFRSIYQIMNYLAYSFLRACDSEHDTIAEPVPDEVKEMFDDLGTPKLPVRFRKARPNKTPNDI